jgi:tRNA (guanine37-N1)-methyltransferase
MNINIFILTLFPDFFESFKQLGVVGQFLQGKRAELGTNNIRFEIINIRDFSLNKYNAVDDSPYGGGPGMVMRADVLARALREGVWERFGMGKADDPIQLLKEKLHVVIPTPRGQRWQQKVAFDLANQFAGPTPKSLVFICGRYEGIDERFIERYADASYSLGDFVLSGGDLAVAAMCDSIIRFIPGALGNPDSWPDESFQNGLLEYPQYTRPPLFEGIPVPEELTSGNHRSIADFQWKERIQKTKELRPDLWLQYSSQFVLDD